MCLPNGDLLTVYRQDTAHAVSTTGHLRKRTSTDEGATWSTATTILDEASVDVRDPASVLLANGDVVVSYFESTGPETQQAKVITSTDDGATWGSPITITNTFTDWAAVCGPVVQLPNGDLLAALFGEDTSETRSSVRISRSTDGGATWAHLSELVDGPTSGRDWQEPNLLLLANGDLLCMLRSDATTGNHIYRSTSTDSGATWSAPVFAFSGSGRPAVAQRASDGLVVCAFRTPGSDEDCRFRTSTDNGVTWSVGVGDFTGGSGLFYCYAQFVTLDTGQLAVVYALEASASDSDLYFAKLT